MAIGWRSELCCSGRLLCPGGRARGDEGLHAGWLGAGPVLGLPVQGGESVQVVGSGEEVEVGVDFGAPPDPGSAAAVAAEHQMAEFPVDFRPGRTAVARPVGVGWLVAGFGEGGFVAADVDGGTRLGGCAVFPDSADPVSTCTYSALTKTLRTHGLEISMSPVWRIPRGFGGPVGLATATWSREPTLGWCRHFRPVG